jgi:hypothetical protein
MPKSAMVQKNAALVRERRTNRRLRVLLNVLLESVHENRRDLNVQFTRLAQLQAEVDMLKVSRPHLGS